MVDYEPHPRSRLRIEIADRGTIVYFTPLDKRARSWIEENCWFEPWQWQGGSLVVCHRPAKEIIAAIQEIWSGLGPLPFPP